MKALDFRKVQLHEAFRIRLEEASKLIEEITIALVVASNELSRDINKGTSELNWADLGSLAQAVEQLEEAATALGVDVENNKG